MMTIEPCTYGPWRQAFRCRQGSRQLIALADVGPRVLAFGWADGPNLLFEDHDNRYRRGAWSLYGGHRFWVGPETEQAFAPENASCVAAVEDGWLILRQTADAMGLQKRLEIGADPTSEAFILRHVVENGGRLLYPGTIWTLTCARPHPVVVPWSAGSDSWRTGMVRYWFAWDGHTTDPAGGQWHPRRDHFLLTPNKEEGKVGLYSEQGLLALLQPDCTFVKCYQPRPEATYPDGGCNVELYTCRDFVELETLSPLYTFHPGCTYVHEEHWLLLKETFEPGQWPAMGQAIHRLLVHGEMGGFQRNPNSQAT